MDFNIREYNKMLSDMNISVIYSGPIWEGAIADMAGILQKKLDFDELPRSASLHIFSVFIEQMTNMLMYSAEKERIEPSSGPPRDVSKGIFVLGMRDKSYFIKTGNVVMASSAAILKERIDYLNSLDKKALRKYHMERALSENKNPESKGAGLGLIEIARRASSKIEYELLPQDDGLLYFTMNVTI